MLHQLLEDADSTKAFSLLIQELMEEANAL